MAKRKDPNLKQWRKNRMASYADLICNLLSDIQIKKREGSEVGKRWREVFDALWVWQETQACRQDDTYEKYRKIRDAKKPQSKRSQIDSNKLDKSYRDTIGPIWNKQQS